MTLQKKKFWKNIVNLHFDKKTTISNMKDSFKSLYSFLTFFLLVYLYFIITITRAIKFLKPVTIFLEKIAEKIDYKKDEANISAKNPSRMDIIDLAMQNMHSKKTRTYITIGGMTIGIGVIVFLISIGYGLQTLVVNRVARLEELKQADITTAPGSKIKLNDKTLSLFQGIDGVEKTLPIINVVGKVNYNNSATDMAVYGVTKDYLQHSAIKPVIGRIFENNDIVSNSVRKVIDGDNIAEKNAIVAEVGDKLADLRVTVNQDTWLVVRDKASRDGRIIGYINNEVGELKAEQIWGDSYIDNEGNGKRGIRPDGTPLGLWLKVSVPVWAKEGEQYVPLTNNEGNQVYTDGYVARIDIQVREIDNRVLGDTIDVTNDDWINLNEELPETQNVEIVKMAQGEYEAVVNRAFLELLQIPESEVLGKTFEVTLIATGVLLESNEQKIQSEPTTYTIIGVTPDNKTAQFYVPFTDLRSLGINNFSQIKIVTDNEKKLAEIRKKVEGLGYNTYSVVDTVEQISTLFSTVRMVMGVLGFIALTISTLGMFNTLTVSLIERTREVGLLKAIGMKSHEVKDLFFAESILMGSLGGILGIFFGVVVGKVLEFGLSMVSIAKGIGPITIVDIPLPFTISIIVLSFLVGVLTGIYPARRATKISALNALRYE